MTERTPVCFVVMPFGGEFDAVFDDLIRPGLPMYEVIRADTKLDQRNILEAFVTGLYHAELVVADLTGTNANVMYELGIAHTLGKPTLMIAQSITALPFDIRSYPVLEYSTHFSKANELQRRLKEFGAQHLSGNVLFGNPVTDYLPEAFGTAQLPMHRSSKKYSITQCITEVREGGAGIIGFFKSMQQRVEMMTARIKSTLDSLATARDSSSSPADRQRVLTEFADDVRRYAIDIEELLPPLQTGAERLSDGMFSALTGQIDAFTNEQLSGIASSNDSLNKQLSDYIGKVAALKESYGAFRGYSPGLTQAIDVLEQALAKVLGGLMLAKARLARVDRSIQASLSSA